jgi:hypothetical protein
MTLVEALRYHASLMIAPEVAPKVRALLNDASTVMWAAAEALSTESEIGRSEPTTVPFCDIAGFKFHEGETYRFRKMYNCAACAKAEMEMFNVQR